MTEIETKMFNKLQSEHLDFELTRSKFIQSIVDVDTYDRHQARYEGIRSAARVVLNSDQIEAACNWQIKLTK